MVHRSCSAGSADQDLQPPVNSLQCLVFRPAAATRSRLVWAEIVGGILFALGLLMPIAAAATIAVMIVAVFTVHISKGFFNQNGGYEYNLVLSVAALTLAFTGPGSLSLEAFLNYSNSGTVWGVAAFLVGVVGGTIPLLERKASESAGTSSAK